jgi:hypothetical protein
MYETRNGPTHLIPRWGDDVCLLGTLPYLVPGGFGTRAEARTRVGDDGYRGGLKEMAIGGGAPSAT